MNLFENTSQNTFRLNSFFDKTPKLITSTGNVLRVYPKDGRKFTEEHKKKISQFFTGRKRTEEECRRISLRQFGTKRGPLTEEHKEKLRIAITGKKHPPVSDEWRKRNSETHKGKPGTKWTSEMKSKMSETMKLKGLKTWFHGAPHCPICGRVKKCEPSSCSYCEKKNKKSSHNLPT